MPHEHTTKSFDTDIEGMRSAVLKIGGLVEQQLKRACQAMLEEDLQLITQVLADEEIVNRLHTQADMLCQQIIALRQPIAVDLREVIGSLHCINDLERIGDEAKKIALRARRMAEPGAESFTLRWPKDRFQSMAEIATQMLSTALDAYARHDSSIAAQLARRDKDLDSLRDQMNLALLGYMEDNSSDVQYAIEVVFAVQALERIGDHSKNVSEFVFNVVEGVDLRHSAAV